MRLERSPRRPDDLPAEPHARARGAENDEENKDQEPTNQALHPAKLRQNRCQARNEG